MAHTTTRHSRSIPLKSFLYFLLTLLLTLSTTHAQSTPLSPVPVTYPGSARTPTRLFVLSGGTTVPSNNVKPLTTQFFYLDLSIPWNTTTSTSPAWVQLRPGPQSGNFPGTASADSKNLFFFRIPGDEPVYQFSLETGNWSPAKPAVPRFAAAGVEGIGAVTDPGTDLVYLAGGYTDPNHGFLDVYDWRTGSVTSTKLPDPTNTFADRTYYTAAWCKSRGSVLYWGGYSTVTRTNFVSELKPPNNWFTLPTSGPAPANRSDHCMAINDDGTKLIIHGGRLDSNDLSNELFILNIATSTWSTGKYSALPRIYSACTIAGDQFIVWGGLTSLTQMASSEVLVYNMASDTWVTQYTPTAAYQNMVAPPIPGAVGASVSGTSPPGPSSSTGAGGSNVGGIIGGVVGGLALICIVGFLFYRRRRHQRRQQKNTVLLEAITDTGMPKSAAPGAGGKDGGSAGHQELQPFIATAAHNQHPQGAAYGSSVGGYPDPLNAQAPPVGSDLEFQLRRKELENQQRQIELRRELLALEEQEQRLRIPGSQYQQEQQQYQQQVPVQFPMTMGVSKYPVTAATVQALPVTTSLTSMEGQYYPTEPIYAPHNAGPMIFIPNGSTSTPSGPSPLNVYNYAEHGANRDNNTQSGGSEGRKGKANNPHAVL